MAKRNHDVANQVQARFLRERIGEHFRELRGQIYEFRLPAPARVKAAQKLVRQWQASTDKLVTARKDRATKTLKAKSKQAEQAVLFSKPAEALRAVEQFEKYELPK